MSNKAQSSSHVLFSSRQSISPGYIVESWKLFSPALLRQSISTRYVSQSRKVYADALSAQGKYIDEMHRPRQIVLSSKSPIIELSFGSSGICFQPLDPLHARSPRYNHYIPQLSDSSRVPIQIMTISPIDHLVSMPVSLSSCFNISASALARNFLALRIRISSSFISRSTVAI